ncbi:MAG TPA: 8-oxoguanine DNA glycosylase [Candidatus Eisenbergiella pullistercoris]|uniref:DNA-(apurinic or apyrimidinic site) lyase n=1 Tax=Candidatus Eisenbergiella pullistercoris TaxID=2838555 RepID=A0A9D2C4K0_9FIRM|nr:8-oxoguanine DNA glycosylase [Candidatus Eisenbergiella pullistercoris]
MYERILTDFDIRTILNSGQVFRIRPLLRDSGFSTAAGETFLAAAGSHAVLIRQKPEAEGRMRVSFSCTEEEFSDFWNGYFDLNRDYEAIRRSVDPGDSFLTSAVRCGRGIRILRQDLWETIISFLVSQNNNITRIRRSLEALCERYGEKIPVNAFPDSPSASLTDASVHAFPSPEAVLEGGPDGLEGLGLGYRDKYIFRMAQRCVGQEGREWLSLLRKSSYEDALALLLKEYGIGKKVADCICLFALHHVDAFPVDTHMKQILSAFYPEGFPFSRYEGYAGILQQYMFYYKLTQKRTS